MVTVRPGYLFIYVPILYLHKYSVYEINSIISYDNNHNMLVMRDLYECMSSLIPLLQLFNFQCCANITRTLDVYIFIVILYYSIYQYVTHWGGGGG